VDLNSLLFGDLLTAGPADLLRAGIALGMLLILVCGRYQQLVFLAVDPEGAAAAGLPVRRLQQLLSLATTLVIVIGMAVAVGGFGLSLLLNSPPGPVIACLCVPLLLGSAAAPHRGRH